MDGQFKFVFISFLFFFSFDIVQGYVDFVILFPRSRETFIFRTFRSFSVYQSVSHNKLDLLIARMSTPLLLLVPVNSSL